MKKNLTIILGSMLLMIVMCFVAGKEVKAETSEDGRFHYEILNDGTIEITHYNEWVEELTIPATIDEYEVSRIGDEAFSFEEDLTSIIIPEGVTSIGAEAFDFCEKLESVVLPNSVNSWSYVKI